MTPDPIGGDLPDFAGIFDTNPQSLNRYTYALNNPTTFTDPLGLQPGDDSVGPSQCFVGSDEIIYCNSYSEPGPGDPLLQLIYQYDMCGMNLECNYQPVGTVAPSKPVLPKLGVLDTPKNLLPPGPSCSAQASAFVSANDAYANQIAQTTGVPATNLLGLSALESGFGRSPLATRYNNYFGLEVGSAFKGTTGVYTTPGGRNFGIYPSPGFLTSGLSFAQSFQGSRVSGVTDPTAFANRLTTPPLAFNSESGYAAELIARIDQVSSCH